MELKESTIERYDLSVGRIRMIPEERLSEEKYQRYFAEVATFLLQIDELRQMLESGAWDALPLREKQEWNRKLYEDILPESYGTSYANPQFAVRKLGDTFGQVFSLLYTELRAEIAYVFEQNIEYLAICNELFIEIYNCFETGEPTFREVKNIIYWYASDYTDVFAADRIEEQIDPARDFAVKIIMESNLESDDYLYRYGEYISENELGTARYLRTLPEETIRKMADVYTEGYRRGFELAGIDLSKKSVVNIRYALGFERVIRKAIENFEKLGLRPSIYRAAVSALTKRQHKVGYVGGNPNPQYDYDHRQDAGLFMDKKYMERKLEVLRQTYEKNRELAAEFAGPAVMEVFGQVPFSPETNDCAVKMNEKQEAMLLAFDSKSGQITNEYIRGDERSFTIVAYPLPEIGEQYPEIFQEVIRINTLDAALYEQVQQTLIDALDQGRYVHILGKGENETDLVVQLYRLRDPQRETIFENCVADVNIPVGEVFTSPVLEGTDGVLHVSKVYLNELQYQNLRIEFQDGKVSGYSCSNFATEQEGREYIHDNLLYRHETLPLGEFAIGTNTTAYVAAKKYGIEEKLPILIAEKMGPHFALGDTCYSWSEENVVHNPNGKEIVARDNSISILRKEDVSKAYFQCHTDITIPYEELERITVVTEDGREIDLIADGRFVLPGTEVLNEPLTDLERLSKIT